MNILVITDTPIAKGFDAPMDKRGAAVVETLSTKVDTIFVEDFIKDNTGARYEVILLPRTLAEMEEIHRDVYVASKLAIAHCNSGAILYYGEKYHPEKGELLSVHKELIF